VKSISGGLPILLVLAFAAQSWAQTCTVSAVPVQFGLYNLLEATPLEAVGNVTISCPSGTRFTVSLDPGENAGTTFHPRRLRSDLSGRTLNYNLYTNPAHTQVWGDGTNNTFIKSAHGTGSTEVLNIYGRLPARQTATAGLYRDSITVTVEW